MLTTNNSLQIITKPARVAENSSAIIDHKLSKVVMCSLISVTIRTDLTDHYLKYCFIPNCYYKKIKFLFIGEIQFNSNISYNDLYENRYYFFIGLLEIIPKNYNIIFHKVIDVVKATINLHAPIKRLSCKDLKFKLNPLFTKGIKFSIIKKQKSYVSHFINGNKNTYKKIIIKKYANKVSKFTSIAKKLFSERELNHSRLNIAKHEKLSKLFFYLNKSLINFP